MAIAIRIPRMMMTTRSSMRVKPSSPSMRLRRLFSIRVLLSRKRQWWGARNRFGQTEGRGFAAPFRFRDQGGAGALRAGAEEDICARAVLEERVGTDRRRDAVGRRRRRGRAEDDVLDSGVVARLQLRERRAHVAVVVGGGRLDAGDGRADVRLRCRLAGAILAAEVRGDGDRHQDPEDDDDDQELDEREALVTLQARPQFVQHVVPAPSESVDASWWPDTYRPLRQRPCSPIRGDLCHSARMTPVAARQRLVHTDASSTKSLKSGTGGADSPDGMSD